MISFETLKHVDWDVINRYNQNNLIYINKHSNFNIFNLNYTPKVQFEKLWDEITISARGLIVDEKGKILARPFKKFFNLEEHSHIEFLDQEYDIYEKLDGSLIIFFYYEKEKTWILSSRKSFDNIHVNEAKKIINENYFNNLDNKNTYIFELISPVSKVVVDYKNRRDLVLLSVIETQSGFEMYYDDMVDKYSKFFTIVKKINTKKNFSELKKSNFSNQEGYVIRFLNGDRVKIKFNNYINLHKIIKNISTKSVWELLKTGKNVKDEIINQKLNVNDECYEWIIKTEKKLKDEFIKFEINALKEFIRIYHTNNKKSREEFALEALNSKYSSVIFLIYDNKPYDKIIWKLIKPKFSTFF